MVTMNERMSEAEVQEHSEQFKRVAIMLEEAAGRLEDKQSGCETAEMRAEADRYRRLAAELEAGLQDRADAERWRWLRQLWDSMRQVELWRSRDDNGSRTYVLRNYGHSATEPTPEAAIDAVAENKL